MNPPPPSPGQFWVWVAKNSGFWHPFCSGGGSWGALFRLCLGMWIACYLQNQYKNTREEGSIPKTFGEDCSAVSESLFCDCNFNNHGGSRELMWRTCRPLSGWVLRPGPSFNNRPFPSSKNARFQSEANCKTLNLKMSFICMSINIFMWIASHLASLYNEPFVQLGTGHPYCTRIVEPRYNEPLYDEVLGITNDFLYPSNSKIYERESRYSEQTLPVPWPFVVSRFHCNRQ